MQLLIFALRMVPLAHIHTYVNSMIAQGWASLCRVSTASAVGPILQEIALTVRRHHIHVSVGRVPGEENKMSDAALRITYLPGRKFLSHFCTHFP